MFDKRRSETKESIKLIEDNLMTEGDMNRTIKGALPQESAQPRNSQAKEPKRGRQKPSVVDVLCARAALEDAPSGVQQRIEPAPGGPGQDMNISAVLEKLKPKMLEKFKTDHNQHLRRSSRTSSEFKKSYGDLFDNEDDDPALERYSKIHGLGEPWKKPLIYPKVGRKKATVEFSDLERLDEGQFLNDNLLSFYLLYLEYTLKAQRPEIADRVYFFNTYFFATLMSTHKGKKGFNYEGVQKWTRSVDLFTYDYIIVPINEYAHWYLAIICNLTALDRNLALDSDEVASPTKAVFARDSRDITKSSELSSSPACDLIDKPSINPTKDEKELDEKTARNSFAEMSLDGDIKSSTEDTRRNLKNAERTSWKDDDQEMLDVPIRDAMPSSMTNDAKGRTENTRETDDITIEDVIEDHKEATKSKRGKKASAPPAVTRISPDRPVIITFDSLGMPRSSTIKVLKDYLREEAKAKRGGMEFDAGQIKGITARQIPQQENGSDCGLFLLGYVAKFLEANPREFIAKIIRREYDETRDWPNLRPSTLRNNIRDQILELHGDLVAERQKERQAAIGKKPNTKQDQGPHSSPARAAPPAPSQATSRKPQSPEKEKVEKIVDVPQPTRPITRKEALQTALTLEATEPKERVKISVPKTHIDNEVEVYIHKIDRGTTGNEAEPRSPKPRVYEPKKTEYHTPGAKDNEPSVIYVESQSQQDGSAPKSFSSSHPVPPTHTQVQNSPELPAEIKDSQPSQTSQTFAKIAKGTSNDNNDESQEIPVIPLENARQAKKRRTGDGAAVVTVTAETPKRSTEDTSDIPNWGNQGNASTKRKRGPRKTQAQVQRSDEVINIDDD